MAFKTYYDDSKGAVWVPSILLLEENNYFLELEKLQYPKAPVLTRSKKIYKKYVITIFPQNCLINDIITILGTAICTIISA